MRACPKHPDGRRTKRPADHSARCVPCRNERRKIRDIRTRLETLAYLGGACRVCGFDDWRALQIDHVAGGGTRAYKENRSGHHGGAYFRRIQANQSAYQILCANHNWIKRYEKDEARPR